MKGCVRQVPRLPKDYSKAEQKQARNFIFVLYPDSESYDCQLLLNRLPHFWDSFYYILHDRDVYTESDYDSFVVENKGSTPDWKIGDLKKPHYHVVVHSDSPVMLGRAITKSGLSSGVFICKDLKSQVQYLIHMNHPSKYQYHPEEIITNATNLQKLLTRKEDAEEKAAKLFDAIQSTEICSITALSSWAIQNHCWDELRRGQHIYSALLYEKLKINYQKEFLP